MTSIHDSLLTRYAVDGKARSVILHTEQHAGGGEAIIDVVFLGGVAYRFEGDCLRNIVFEVEEVSPEDVVGDGAAFAERHRLYGWPRDWNSLIGTLAQFFNRTAVKVFELRGSYGMGGWVAAESMEQRYVSTPA